MASKIYYTGMFKQSVPMMVASHAVSRPDFQDRYSQFVDNMDPEWLASRIHNARKDGVSRPITYHMGLTQEIISVIKNGAGYLDSEIADGLKIEQIVPSSSNVEQIVGCKIFEDEIRSFPTMWSKSLFIELNGAIADIFYNGKWWKKNVSAVSIAFNKYKMMGGIMSS